MGRAPKAEKVTTPVEGLIAAMQFVSVAQSDKGEVLPYQQHVVMRNGTIMAFDGVLAAGTMADFSSIATAPQTFMLAAALKKCKGTGHSITQLPSGGLIVKSGAFCATVPAIPIDSMATVNIYPDNNIAPINDNLKAGFTTLLPLLVENSTHVVNTTILLQGFTMLATDRVLLAEYYHGVDLPPNLIIPKAFVAAVAKSTKKLTGFGYSQTSVTFWYEDHSWIKTQLHTEQWPNAARLFDFKPNIVPVPKRLKEAVESVVPFIEDGAVYLNPNEVASALDNTTGATHDCKDLPGGCKFAAKRLLAVLDFATDVDWDSQAIGVYWQGPSIRAMLGKMT